MPAPELYLDLVLVPQITGVDPLRFIAEYPPAVRMLMRDMVRKHIAAGWAGNLQVVSKG